MLKSIITLALALMMARISHAQTYLPDTIRVNKLTTTYLIFPAKVSLVDISPEYLVKIESGNIVFVRPRLTSARKSPIFVRTESGTFLGYLTVSGKTPPAFVEVNKLLVPPAPKALPVGTMLATQTNPASVPAPVTGVSPANGPLVASLSPLAGVAMSPNDVEQKPAVGRVVNNVQSRMDALLSGPASHHERERNSGISVKLTHLLHDSTNTFIQLTLTNKTAMPFLLDQVSFWYQHQAKKRKGAYLDGETYPMEPVFETIPERVEAGQKVQMRFALPQFAPQSRSRFVINVREKTGTRNVSLSLPMRSVLYARAPKDNAHLSFFERDRIKLPRLTWFRHEGKK